jgi:phosphoenolpyruvate---glycerone phosphotransferase subunit DhaL
VTRVITETTIPSAAIVAWMSEINVAVQRHRDHLTQLDAAIGDGDHGTNMARGFGAVQTTLTGQGDDLLPGQLLILCGKTLVATVGGASGPLWGTAFRHAGRAVGAATELDGPLLADALDAALAGITGLGRAEVGDATIVDALDPAARALRSAVQAGAPLSQAAGAAAGAAEDGCKATIPLQARKGRASYLGERSIGHQDPGATSTALILRALETALSR